MSKAEEYKAHAAECVALARATKDKEEKARLLELAEAWKSLADEKPQSRTKGDE